MLTDHRHTVSLLWASISPSVKWSLCYPARKPEGLLCCDKFSTLFSVGLGATTSDPLTKAFAHGLPIIFSSTVLSSLPLLSPHHPNCKHSLLCLRPALYPPSYMILTG